MSALRRFLAQPLPAPEPSRHTVFTSLAAGVFIAGFLIVFQPFGAYAWNSPRKIPVLAGYGVITFAVLLFNGFVLPRLLPSFFREERWTVGREIVFVGLHILSIGLANYVYGGFVYGNFEREGWQPAQLAAMILVTGVVGLFPATGITVFKYLRYLRRYAQPPQPAPLTATERAADERRVVELVAENGKDRLALPLADVLYLESADNYSEIVYEKAGSLKKELLRGSLSRFEAQVPPGVVVRCHRSYLVNLHRVRRVTGNAQGYKLHLDGLETPLPVARAYSEVVKSFREQKAEGREQSAER